MAQQLVYTSSPKGLQPGAFGFCVVASTRGIPDRVASFLTSTSGYRRVFAPETGKGALNPVAYTHMLVESGAQTLRILSRVADAGLDYTNRTNKIASFLLLDRAEQPTAGPAAILDDRASLFYSTWNQSPKWLEPIALPNLIDAPTALCEEWRCATGSYDWGAALATTVYSGTPVTIVYAPDQNVNSSMRILKLFQESIRLLPPAMRWKATFSTYYMNAPLGSQCQWRAVLAGSQEEANLRANPRALLLDLTRYGASAPIPDAILRDANFANMARQARGEATAQATPIQTSIPVPQSVPMAQGASRPIPPWQTGGQGGGVPPQILDGARNVPGSTGTYPIEGENRASGYDRSLHRSSSALSSSNRKKKIGDTAISLYLTISIMLFISVVLALALLYPKIKDAYTTNNGVNGTPTAPAESAPNTPSAPADPEPSATPSAPADPEPSATPSAPAGSEPSATPGVPASSPTVKTDQYEKQKQWLSDAQSFVSDINDGKIRWVEEDGSSQAGNVVEITKGRDCFVLKKYKAESDETDKDFANLLSTNSDDVRIRIEFVVDKDIAKKLKASDSIEKTDDEDSSAYFCNLNLKQEPEFKFWLRSDEGRANNDPIDKLAEDDQDSARLVISKEFGAIIILESPRIKDIFKHNIRAQFVVGELDKSNETPFTYFDGDQEDIELGQDKKYSDGEFQYEFKTAQNNMNICLENNNLSSYSKKANIVIGNCRLAPKAKISDEKEIGLKIGKGERNRNERKSSTTKTRGEKDPILIVVESPEDSALVAGCTFVLTLGIKYVAEDNNRKGGDKRQHDFKLSFEEKSLIFTINNDSNDKRDLLKKYDLVFDVFYLPANIKRVDKYQKIGTIKIPCEEYDPDSRTTSLDRDDNQEQSDQSW